MVLPFSSDMRPERLNWKRWLISILILSFFCGGAWLWISHDLRESLIALGIPWFIGAYCLGVSVIFGIATIPLMVLMGRFGRDSQLQNKIKKE